MTDPMTLALAVLCVALLAGDFISGRVIYWQRRRIVGLKQEIALLRESMPETTGSERAD